MSDLYNAPELNICFDDIRDDWDAVERWLTVLAEERSTGTLTTYRFHLAKLRWYCDHAETPPLKMWSAADFLHFKEFLHASPFEAVCPKNAKWGDPGYTPFKVAPAKGSAEDIIRFVHALFGIWHAHGYITVNPAIDHKLHRKTSVTRSTPGDGNFLDQVIDHMKSILSVDLCLVRDLFVIMALRELGLSASELVEASMSDVASHPHPSFERSAIFRAAHNRILPMSSELLSVFRLYRRTFGLPSSVQQGEELPLVLSIRKFGKGFRHDPQTTGRRGTLRGIRSRQGLLVIVKSRICAVAADLERSGNMSSATTRKFANTRWIRHVFERDTILTDGPLLNIAHKMGWKQPIAGLKNYLSAPPSLRGGRRHPLRQK
ncbi:hypothetical protein GTP56_16985 [Duganella sp. FT134W]|uniref:Tyrosine-type recombinase/integrase n=1 Tax=Duganella margarita TaxID=2692170 RepID=A0A7X4H230_9BURK|nr:hypothetical protein [Duganella margarita]MYM73886.1 hypothetical protein [Duganella margarita]